VEMSDFLNLIGRLHPTINVFNILPITDIMHKIRALLGYYAA
jgi:hypothetical protein